MITLRELKEIEGAAESSEQSARSLAMHAEMIATARKGGGRLLDVVQELTRHLYSSDQPRVDALLHALAVVRDDVLRLAELRLEALARERSNRGRALRAQIAAYCGEESNPVQKEPTA